MRIYAPAAALLVIVGCIRPENLEQVRQRPDVAPVEQTFQAEALRLDSSQIKPMYTEMMPIDLATVARVAVAQNFDIRQARHAVEASQGRYESAVGNALPVIVPTALFEHVEGTVRATEGNLVGVGFNTFQPSIAIQWVINPGKVVYEIIAAKKRLFASERREEAVLQQTLRQAGIQFYALVLGQARVAAAHQGVLEAEELARISRLRRRTGTGVLADEMRAEARLAQRRQELVTALKGLYGASVDLALNLRIDASVTLVPSIESLPPIQLVREELGINELLDIAVTFRPDLASVRRLVEAVTADTSGTWWSGWGPKLSAGYQFGSISAHTDNTTQAQGIPSNLIVNPASPTGSFSTNPVRNGLIREGIGWGSRLLGRREDQSFGPSDQQRGSAGIGWRLSFAIIGDLKTARSQEASALLDLERLLDQVKAQVVTAAQDGTANRQLIDLAHQQVQAAEEALRLSEVNLKAGTMTTLDVLQSQDAATQARLRYSEAVVRYNQSQINLLASLGLVDVEVFLGDTGGG